MSHTAEHRQQEEEEKLLICGALVNYANAKAACAAMDSTLEMDNLVRTLIPDLKGDAKKYYDQVKRRAEQIVNLATEIIDLAEGFGEDF
jgi:isopenicillin N synthase-like dioxygenase